MPLIDLQFMIVVFPDHTHLLFRNIFCGTLRPRVAPDILIFVFPFDYLSGLLIHSSIFILNVMTCFNFDRYLDLEKIRQLSVSYCMVCAYVRKGFISRTYTQPYNNCLVAPACMCTL